MKPLAVGAWVFVWAVGAAAIRQDTPRTAWDGVYTKEQAERGSVTYRRACRKCHYADLRGDEFGGGTPGEVAPGLVDAAFFSRWNELTLGDLFLAILRSMPNDRPGTLKPNETADVLTYILKRNAFPAGDVELTTEFAQLKRILITEEE